MYAKNFNYFQTKTFFLSTLSLSLNVNICFWQHIKALVKIHKLREMMPAQLKVTTMNKETRKLIKVTIPNEKTKLRKTNKLVDDLMGKNAELRLKFITENAHNELSLDI